MLKVFSFILDYHVLFKLNQYMANILKLTVLGVVLIKIINLRGKYILNDYNIT